LKVKVKSIIVICLVLLYAISINAQPGDFKMARVKYSGGSDWYNDPSSDINLLKFLKANTNLKVNPEYRFADLATEDIFSYPFLFMTGHGNIALTDQEILNLKKYLENGGFLYVDDDYGFDKGFRREIKKVFPNQELKEIPYTHKIYNMKYKFSDGPPKTHKHDEKAPQGFGLFIGDRMVVYYTYESNPSDGWADPEVHNDPEAKRIEALQFGTNIVLFALTQ
jgi:hypothetical protein